MTWFSSNNFGPSLPLVGPFCFAQRVSYEDGHAFQQLTSPSDGRDIGVGFRKLFTQPAGARRAQMKSENMRMHRNKSRGKRQQKCQSTRPSKTFPRRRLRRSICTGWLSTRREANDGKLHGRKSRRQLRPIQLSNQKP